MKLTNSTQNSSMCMLTGATPKQKANRPNVCWHPCRCAVTVLNVCSLLLPVLQEGISTCSYQLLMQSS